MEYGSKICDLPCNDNYVKHVGYSESNGCIQEYYSMLHARSFHAR